MVDELLLEKWKGWEGKRRLCAVTVYKVTVKANVAFFSPTTVMFV